MNEKATIHTIARMLVEAAVRQNTTRQTQKLRAQLESKLKRLFLQQGKAYLRYFAYHRNEFAEALTDSDIDGTFDRSSQSARMAQTIDSAVESALTLGAENLLKQFTDEEFKKVFNLKNPRAVKYLENYGANRVTQLDDTSKGILKRLLTDGVDKGQSYSRMVTLIRRQFTEWSTKRAKLIAVTEIGNAYQQGNLIVGLDLADAGLQMEKSWLTRGDDKVDPHCSANAAQGWIDVKEAHASGAMCPLDHVGCRCLELYRRKVSK